MVRFKRDRRRLAGQRGQTATEYVLVIATLAIGSAYVTYVMFDSENGPVKNALEGLLGDGTTSTATQKNIPDQIQRGYITANPL